MTVCLLLIIFLFKYTTIYTFFADGRVDVALDGEFDKSREFLPRLGFEFTTGEQSFMYFGYGPGEAYVDMHHGLRMGIMRAQHRMSMWITYSLRSTEIVAIQSICHSVILMLSQAVEWKLMFRITAQRN